MAGRLPEVRIVVTGASRGLGAALAGAFAAEGARLALTATALPGLEATLAECAARGAPATGLELDLADPRSVGRAGAACLEALDGRVDVLVNNAGLLGARGPLLEQPMDLWRRVMEVGVNGTMHLTQLIAPAIPAGGAIVNVTSGAAGRPGWGAYAMSRLALNGITQILRTELADRGIRCVAINPGGVRTEMRAAAYPEEDPTEVPPPEARVEPFIAVAAGADPGWYVEAADWAGG